MKATKLLLAAALFTSLATLSLAGPGAEYWTRMSQAEKDRAAAKAQTAASASVQTPTPAAACGSCGCCSAKKS
jgi:hypothetical protein